jgi:hypothetical protein
MYGREGSPVEVEIAGDSVVAGPDHADVAVVQHADIVELLIVCRR